MRRLLVALALMSVAADARAQSAPFSIRGFADAGFRTFRATKSFTAILGSDSAAVFGGGVDVLEPHGFFGELRASSFTGTGKRVFVAGNDIFSLNVVDRIRIVPLELTGGYRFDRGWRIVPYGGGGVGWHRMREFSPSSDDDEDVSETFRGYHVMAGAEIRLRHWLAAAGEGQWATVPHALGSDPNGVSAAFGETDLGGFSARIKILIGR